MGRETADSAGLSVLVTPSLRYRALHAFINKTSVCSDSHPLERPENICKRDRNLKEVRDRAGSSHQRQKHKTGWAADESSAPAGSPEIGASRIPTGSVSTAMGRVGRSVGPRDLRAERFSGASSRRSLARLRQRRAGPTERRWSRGGVA
ncbi:hypothetical protein EVAR_60475_1 [Eumeta japonica]|uniref:Uncharacterized protein n=1 Tax=Eumeta variegata TaxID=151549 RepID=A0A4C1ZKS0_EUMVA|nr:hypothetical protein EVAR_60475_1 [Eumeta japonica]